MNRIAAVTGRDLSGADPSHDEAGRPDVNFTLNRDGAERFGRVTGANIGKLLAIVLDNRVFTAPVIHGQITDRGQISGRELYGRNRPVTSPWCYAPAPYPLPSTTSLRRPSARHWEPTPFGTG